MDFVKDIREFQEKIAEKPEGSLMALTGKELEEAKALRIRLIREEVEETLKAIQEDNYIEVLDGAVDTLYVLLGTLQEYGIVDKFYDAWELIHKNNMSKLGPDGKVLKDSEGKVIKPEGYKRVELNILF